MAYSASFALDLGTTGLTLKARLTTAGTIAASDLTGTFYADGAGGYEFRTSAIPDGTRAMLVFYTGTFSVDFTSVTVYARASINPQELENADVKTSSVSGSGGSGSGAYAITITVTDTDDNELQNAHVSLTEGSNVFTATTDADGLASFSLDAATYTVAIVKGGYTYTPITLVVTEADAVTLEMTAMAVTAPSDPTLCRIYGWVRSTANGRAMAGVQLTATRTPATAATVNGSIAIGSRKSAISDANGLVQLDVPQTDQIVLAAGGATQWVITMPDAGLSVTTALTGTTYNLGDLTA